MFPRRLSMILQAPQYDDREDKKLFTVNDIAAPTGVDAQQPGGRWRQLLDALDAGRMLSAGREIERRRDLIALLRRRLAERKEHLQLVPSPSATAATPRTTPAHWFQGPGETRPCFV